MEKVELRNGPKLALVYCRVSSEKQEENSSLDTQADAGIKYAEANGYSVLKVVREVFSGAEYFERPKLIEALAMAKAGMYQAFICYATDRLSREPSHLFIIKEDLKRSGVELFFVTDNINDSTEGEALLFFKGLAAKWEREKIRHRNITGKRAKVISGKLVGAGCDLYGYALDKAAGVRRIKEREARVIRKIFEWTAKEGLGARTIAQRLNEQNIPSPADGKKTFVNGRKAIWGKSQVSRILCEPAYKGETIAWRYKSRGRHRNVMPRPQEEHIKLPDGISPPIVSPELWQAAQDAKARNRGESKRNEKTAFLLRGHIFCSVCGSRLYTEVEKGKTPIYRCCSRQKPYRTNCDGKRVNANKVEAWAWEQVVLRINDPDLISRELKRLEQEDLSAPLITQREALKRELEIIERGQQKLFRLYRNTEDESTLESLEQELRQDENKKAIVKAELANIETRLSSKQSRITELKSLEEFCEQVRTRLDSFGFEDRRLTLKAFNVRISASSKDPQGWDFDWTIPDANTLETSHFGVTSQAINMAGVAAL